MLSLTTTFLLQCLAAATVLAEPGHSALPGPGHKLIRSNCSYNSVTVNGQTICCPGSILSNDTATYCCIGASGIIIGDPGSDNDTDTDDGSATMTCATEIAVTRSDYTQIVSSAFSSYTSTAYTTSSDVSASSGTAGSAATSTTSASSASTSGSSITITTDNGVSMVDAAPLAVLGGIAVAAALFAQ